LVPPGHHTLGGLSRRSGSGSLRAGPAREHRCNRFNRDRSALATCEHADSPDTGLAEVIVLKQRQFGGDVGTTRRLVWVGARYRDFAYQP